MNRLRVAKIAVFLIALFPLGLALWQFRQHDLGPNPVEAITHLTGNWTLILLMATLSVTPLRQLTRQYWLIGLRRMIGLFAFFYACLHFTTYLWLDKFFDYREMLKDIVKRPFITVGFLAFLCLVPLAITSTQGWIRRLGKNWQRLHRLIYLAAAAGVVHYVWLVKADLREPLRYAYVFGVLMLYRVVVWIRQARRNGARDASPATTRV